MATPLTAVPLVASDDANLFIPGPAAYPPLYPALDAYTSNALTATAVVQLSGTYPGADTFPGATTYPGVGSDLTANLVVPNILTGVPA